MNLWLANLAPEVTDDDIRALVMKYCAVEVPEIRREPGDGSRPAAELRFPDVSSDVLHQFQGRLNGMFWMGRKLSAQVM
ncbi:RNA-binding protein [Niveibacterium sp. 24ML]|uniref:RNA recognition motif domain-containing protein n=1 Tax=Niveibacterium sp. 24ML TaxID=2985512 RepID=UPI00227194DF|nr:RNA-binding protein [Niveibacterium sp. 24ML]MCX9156587.1 RNA-binding protein [Niveibacterium sp. 24ML]